MVKRLLFFTFALFFIQISEVFSQITIGTINAGPYGWGSSITVPINFTDNQSEFLPGNVFTLYLSDATGNFIGDGTPIGTFNGFYTPFINGIIPNGLAPGSNYKLQIKSTNPASTISIPDNIDIRNIAVSPITLTPNLSGNALGGDNFGWCPVNSGNGKSISLTSNASAPTTVVVTLKNLITGATTNYMETPGLGFDITGLNLGYYSITATATTIIGGVSIQSVKTYFLHNNNITVNIQDIGKNTGCYSASSPGIPVEYQITLINGIYNNYPGSLYIINWGDGSPPETLTLKQIVDNAARIAHSYTKNSCNEPDIPGPPVIKHSFKATITANNPICNVSSSTTAYAQVFESPTALITAPTVGCTNNQIRFNNSSTGGTKSDCSTQMDYTWYVDGVKRRESSSNAPLDWTFTTNGLHTVKLVASNGVGSCPPSEYIATICIQEPPKPAFEFIGNSTSHCAPYTIKANDKSIVDAICNANNTYNWIVTRNGVPALSTDVTFINGITEPEFTFHKQGTYEVTLQINTATCGSVSTATPQTVIIIDSTPITTLQPTATLCGLGTFPYNNVISGPTNVLFSGTEVDAADTYTWAVTDEFGNPLTNADYTFTNGSNITKYPTIEFKQYITYKVSVTHKNSCDEITTSQLITFKESPSPSIIANSICYNDQALIKGEISNNNYISYTWTTLPTGGSFLNGNTLEPTYIPSPADKTNGKATVILTVNTGLEGDCKFVSISKEFIIHPNNTGSNTTQTICTGETTSFTPSSTVGGSTYTWVAVITQGNATGFSPTGSGAINHTITNNSATQNAVIVYTITPEANGCSGLPFTFTVIVTPKPVIDPVTDKTICHNDPAGIVLTSNIPTRFTWTSVPSSTDIQGNTNGTGSTSLIAGKNSFTINEALLNSSFLPGTVTYTIRSYSGDDCEGTPTTVTITVDPAVTVANAGPDEPICDTDTYQLKGNKANVGTGKWELVSASVGSPQITDDTNFESTVTGLQTNGVYIFKWTISSVGSCPGTEDQVTITVTPKPVVDPVANKTICHSNSTGIVLTSNIPTRFTWTSVPSSTDITGSTNGTGSTSLIGGKNSFTINEALLNNSFLPGTVTYTIRSYSADDCEGTTTTVTITVDPAVTVAYAGGDERICDTETYQLKGNKANVGTGKWELVSASLGSPQITDDTNFESTVTGLQANGVYVFKWIISPTGTCPGTESQVTITVNTPTLPGTTAGAQTVCQNDNTGTITLSGNNGSVLGWQISTDNGATWQDVPGVNTGSTYNYTNLSTTTQFRAIVQNEGCTIAYSTSTTISVAPPTTRANAGDDQILCNETSALLKGNLIASGETGIWTMVSGDPNAVITPGLNSEASVTGLLPGITYVFKWTINGTAPCNPTEDEVTIRNNKPLDLNSLTSNAVVCNGQQVVIDGSVPIGGAENGQYEYIWQIQVNGGGWDVIAGASGEDLTITLTTTGIINFRRIVNSGECSSTSNPFPITVQPPIQGNIITGNEPICSGLTPALITGDLPTGGDGNFSYQWQSSLDGTTWTNIAGVTSLDYQPPVLTETTYYRRLVSTIACRGNLQSISNEVIKTVKPNAKAEFTWGPNDTSCYPYTLPIQVVPYADRNDVYTWYAGTDVIGTGANFPGYTIQESGQSVTIRLVVTNSLGCEAHEMSHTFSTNQAVPASFQPSETEGCGPLPVNLTNTSPLVPGARFEWYNGGVLFSTDVHPSNLTLQSDPLGKDSTYVIKLKAITDCGTDSVSHTVFVKAKPIAVFTPDKVEVCSPSKVTFTNTSPGSTNTYYYDFGDGSNVIPRNDKSPIDHTYNVAVTTDFTVRMTAENSCGTDFKEWKIRVFPQNMTPVLGIKLEEIRGCAPHTVNFENNSIGASRFEFNFGDGTKRTTYTTGIVSHTYTSSDNFTVTMTAFNSCSEITVTKQVEVLPQPEADFEADKVLGCPGLVVKFKNNTVGGLNNSYMWDFGDGNSSPDFEPQHTYNGAQEYYTVKLLATNQLGCPIEVIKTQYIRVVPPPVAAFNVVPSTLISIPNYTFKFEDESTNSPTIWEWDFGDGIGTSSLKNPSYTYLDTGTYNVTLKVINQQGCFTTTSKKVTIKGVPGYLFVPNSFIPGSEIPELRLFRAKGSGIKTWRFSVFNKWGQIIWETSLLDEGRPAEAWDGTFKGQPMPQGVYYWKINVEMVNGTEWKGMTYDKTPPKRTGAIHLIR